MADHDVTHLRVLTFNIWNEEGDERRFAHINRGLRALAPDLIAFQEVARSARHDRLVMLLEGTGLHGLHQADVMLTAPPHAHRYGGSAFASRWPYRVVEVLDPRMSDAMDVPWCSLAVKVPIPGAGDVLFIATAAAWRLDAEAARERQVLALADLDARHRCALPTIIAGDFNARPDAASIRFLSGLQSLNGRSVHYHDAWAVAGEGPGHTWSCGNPNAASVMDQIVRQPGCRRRIDYVFVGSWHAHPQAQCRIESARLVFDQPTDGLWPSDHFGVLVDLDIGSTG
ncbi:MAG TPA: endonuclease/exonuclease/phosphatase family protein [Dongiaceae bacterium]|jgi:endonuclease/exonuclease/phosphatase family metal-dependent hydrolase